MAVGPVVPLAADGPHVGEELGRGRSIAEILAGMKQVAEGVKTAPVVMKVAAEAGYQMIDPGRYQNLTDDFSAQINAFKAAKGEASGSSAGSGAGSAKATPGLRG